MTGTSKFQSNDGSRRFTPSRLTLARKRRGLSQAQLAAACSLSSNSISQYERGKTAPREASIELLADALGVSPEFFYAGEAPQLPPEAVSFRALSRMPAGQRDAVTATAEYAILLDDWLDQRFRRPAPDLPDLSNVEPRAAAEALRHEWGIGSRPIENCIHLLEAHGVRVYSMGNGAEPGDKRYFDALSTWWGEKPFIFIDTAATPERSRYNVCHELGHLLLHRHGSPTGQEAEQQANRFAGSFLVPSGDLRAQARPNPSLHTVISDKRRWKVSALALVYRLHEEGFMQYWQYRDLIVRIRGRFKTSEPNSIGKPETSQVLRKMFMALRDEGLTSAKVADALHFGVADLDDLLFAHFPTSVVGNGQEEASVRPEESGLRLVK